MPSASPIPCVPRSLLTTAALGLALTAGAMAVVAPTPAAAQIGGRPAAGATRKATTVAALVRYPFYFHTQPVRVRGLPAEKNGQFQLEHDNAQVWLMPGGTGKLPDAGKDSEITGLYLDVGRLERSDARVSADFGPLSQRVLQPRLAGAGRAARRRRRHGGGRRADGGAFGPQSRPRSRALPRVTR